jgi:hypothetical protein
MVRDHKAGGKVEPHATRMDELLSGRNRQQSVSGARQLRGSAAAPVVALRQTGQLSSRGYVVDRQSSGKPADQQHGRAKGKVTALRLAIFIGKPIPRPADRIGFPKKIDNHACQDE